MEPGFDMNQIFQAAQQMQAQLQAAQRNLAEAEVTGTAGGGLVVATVSGQGELLDLRIDPKAIDPADPAESADTIADLVLAAIRDATSSVVALQKQQLGFAEALGNIDLSGLGMPGGGPGGPGIPGVPGLPGFGAAAPFGFADEDFDDDDEDFEDDEDFDDDDDDEEDEDDEGRK